MYIVIIAFALVKILTKCFSIDLEGFASVWVFQYSRVHYKSSWWVASILTHNISHLLSFQKTCYSWMVNLMTPESNISGFIFHLNIKREIYIVFFFKEKSYFILHEEKKRSLVWGPLRFSCHCNLFYLFFMTKITFLKSICRSLNTSVVFVVPAWICLPI